MTELEKLQKKEKYLSKNLMSILNHSIIVSRLAGMIGRELGLSESLCYELAVTGVVHDIGKIRLESHLENKKGTLNAEDFRYVRMHSKFSYIILKEYDYSDFILESVLYHHENYDGTGYPAGLQGVDIPVGARILRVCDVFSALIGKRIYRDAFDIDTAVELMIDEIKNYDMKVFLAFQRVIHSDEAVQVFNMARNMPV